MSSTAITFAVHVGLKHFVEVSIPWSVLGKQRVTSSTISARKLARLRASIGMFLGILPVLSKKCVRLVMYAIMSYLITVGRLQLQQREPDIL